MKGWQQYYGAESFLVPLGHSDRPDRALAAALGTDPRGMVELGIGTTFQQAQNVSAAHEAEDQFGDIETWFVHGDPWHVLIGVSPSRIVVGSVDMFAGGYAGPPTVTCLRPVSFDRPALDLQVLADQIVAARRSTSRRMRRCPLCDSPRYSRGCTCDSLALGIIYD